MSWWTLCIRTANQLRFAFQCPIIGLTGSDPLKLLPNKILRLCHSRQIFEWTQQRHHPIEVCVLTWSSTRWSSNHRNNHQHFHTFWPNSQIGLWIIRRVFSWTHFQSGPHNCYKASLKTRLWTLLFLSWSIKDKTVSILPLLWVHWSSRTGFAFASLQLTPLCYLKSDSRDRPEHYHLKWPTKSPDSTTWNLWL